MRTTGERIRYLRQDVLGLRQQAFAEAIGVSRGAVGNWERDLGIKMANLTVIADRFGVPLDWLANGRGVAPAPESGEIPPSPPPPARRAGNVSGPSPMALQPQKMLPVFGRAVGGQDGRFVLNGQKIGDVFAPPSLEHVPDAYAVYVHGSSMEPRYYPGETLWIHPHRPVKQGDFVVVQLRGQEGEPPFGFVKQFVSWTSTELTLKQLNPPKGENELMPFPAEQVVSVHKVMGSFEG